MCSLSACGQAESPSTPPPVFSSGGAAVGSQAGLPLGNGGAAGKPLSPGDLELEAALSSDSQNGSAAITNLAVSADGRLALAGSFSGSLTVPGGALVGDPGGNVTAYVAIYDAAGRLVGLSRLNDGAAWVSGTAFAPDGTLVVRGSANPGSSFVDSHSFVAKLNRRGEQIWRFDFPGGGFTKAAVVVDQTGQVWFNGDEQAAARFGVTPSAEPSRLQYLLQLSEAGKPVAAFRALPDGCDSSVVTDLTIDAADRLLVASTCATAQQPLGAVWEERDSAGAPLVTKHITGHFTIPYRSAGGIAVAVDGERRVSLAGQFQGSLLADGTSVSNGGDPRVNTWIGRYSDGGTLLQHREYTLADAGAPRLASDAANNLLVLNTCSELEFGSLQLKSSDASPWPCLIKLSPDGTPLWGRVLENRQPVAAIAADAEGHIWLAAGSALLRFVP